MGWPVANVAPFSKGFELLCAGHAFPDNGTGNGSGSERQSDREPFFLWNGILSHRDAAADRYQQQRTPVPEQGNHPPDVFAGSRSLLI